MRLKRTKTALKWILHFFKKTRFLEQKRREFLQKKHRNNFRIFVENLVHVQHIESRLDGRCVTTKFRT